VFKLTTYFILTAVLLSGLTLLTANAQSLHDTAEVNRLNELIKSSKTTGKANTDSLLDMAQASAKLATQIQYKRGLAEAIFQAGDCYRLKGNYPAALEQCLESLRISEELKDTVRQAQMYVGLALTQKDLSGANQTEAYLDKGIVYGRSAYNLYNKLRDTAGMINSLNTMGITYRDKGKVWGQLNYYDTAFDAYTKALALHARSGKGKANLGRMYNNISQVYLEYKKDYHTALAYLFSAVHFNDSTRNTSSLSYNYGNISNAYVQLQQYDDGLLYARKMMEAAQLIKRPERIQNAALQLYRAFQAKGLMDSALHYYVKADMLGDSLTNLSKTRQVMDLQTKYETVKKEVEITRLQSESSSKNKQILLLLGSSALLALLAAAMIWLYRRVQKQRRLITEQSVRLEVMMKELHHRVKNNLQIVSSLLSLQTNKLQDEGAISVLKESQLRVQAMSFIHQRLYKKDDLTAVNMKEYLTDLAELLLSTYGYDREGFDLQINANREMLDIDQALPMGLIINEMMTNSLKYAYAGVARPSLHIILTDSAQQLVCQVKDNGIGLDENKWKQKSSSFGKQLITALCKQLRAKQSLVVNAGTQFTITIPKAA
jgi:two-component sensor histidine kinase